MPLLFLLHACASDNPEQSAGGTDEAGKTTAVVFDTDFGPDYDDVGALAVLHALADRGEAEILATIASNGHPLVAPSLDVVNTWFGRPDLPIGAPDSSVVSEGARQGWADSLVAEYPHDLRST
ncbi:MAG: nucleoside hydrolase, partial [Catalinimonas sp.]